MTWNRGATLVAVRLRHRASKRGHQRRTHGALSEQVPSTLGSEGDAERVHASPAPKK